MVEIYIPSEKEFLRLVGDHRIQFMKEKINGCCKQPGNLYSADKDSTGRVTVWRCRTCGRNHYRLIAEPGEFGIMDMIAIQKLINDLMARRDGEKIDPEEIRVILAKR